MGPHPRPATDRPQTDDKHRHNTDRHTDTESHTERRTGRETDRQTNRQPDRQTDRESVRTSTSQMHAWECSPWHLSKLVVQKALTRSRQDTDRTETDRQTDRQSRNWSGDTSHIRKGEKSGRRTGRKGEGRDDVWCCKFTGCLWGGNCRVRVWVAMVD